MILRRTLVVFAFVLTLATSGCAANVARWIVETRDRQGDLALAAGNYPEASVAYQLALKVSPSDVRARAGIVRVQVGLAQQYFTASKFEEALAALAVAAKYDPQDVRVSALREEIDQARLQRQIVLANYPAYSEGISQLRRAYDGLTKLNASVLGELKKFNYTFDTAHLREAIRQSYEYNREVVTYTNRLQSFRQLVESGTPATTTKNGPAAPASLLPLP